MLKILQEQEITNVIVLVQRYFKPPKLGLGPLMRAYQLGIIDYLTTEKLLTIIKSKQYLLVAANNFVNLVYQWQKQYRFVIIRQDKDDLTTNFIINVSDKIQSLPYNFNITITFIKDSFSVNDN